MDLFVIHSSTRFDCDSCRMGLQNPTHFCKNRNTFNPNLLGESHVPLNPANLSLLINLSFLFTSVLSARVQRLVTAAQMPAFHKNVAEVMGALTQCVFGIRISPHVFPCFAMLIREIWQVGAFNTSITGLILTPRLAH